MEDSQDFLRSRRSIRKLKQDPIPENVILRILEIGSYAPSAHNLQPWRFVVITDEGAKSQLASALSGKFFEDFQADHVPTSEIQKRLDRTIGHLKDAPLVIILCREETLVKPQPDPIRQRAEEIMGIQSVAVSGLQLLLAAHSEGLGGTWICWPLFAPDETQQALCLEKSWKPEGMLILGYPAETPTTPTRIPLREYTRFL
jgi:coenzyme F420-0:L-glutamate ligase / coenzyme F420-1:gamma-L-glutamate ligase